MPNKHTTLTFSQTTDETPKKYGKLLMNLRVTPTHNLILS